MPPTIEVFRRDARSFLAASAAADLACPAFGSIMPPSMFQRASAWQQHCFANGFAGIDWEVEYGGRGLSGAHQLAWYEECAHAGIAPYMNFQGIILAGGAIRKFGTDDQKQRYLRATLAADIVWCQLFSEPNAGSDLVSLRTRAEPNGDGWHVTGQKVWSSTAQFAHHGILLARTDGDEPGHRGISFFLFDMAGPGVEVRPLRQMTGDAEFCEVFFDEAPVAQADLLGPENSGWTVASSVLADERASVGVDGIGLARTLAVMREGAKASVGGHHDRLARLNGQGLALGQLLLRSGTDPLLGPLTKLGLTELTSELTGYAVDAMGPEGMLTGSTVDEFLYAPGMRVAGGTSEIQRNLVGERLLGLPRQPRIG